LFGGAGGVRGVCAWRVCVCVFLDGGERGGREVISFCDVRLGGRSV
jgi:hypothetical protein